MKNVDNILLRKLHQVRQNWKTSSETIRDERKKHTVKWQYKKMSRVRDYTWNNWFGSKRDEKLKVN